MNDVTPGKKLILDLLAKSIAKVQAAEPENQDAKNFVKSKVGKTIKSDKIVLKEELTEERENDTREDKKKRKPIKVEKRRVFKQVNATCVELGDHSHQEPISISQVKTEEIDLETDSKKHKKKKKLKRESEENSKPLHCKVFKRAAGKGLKRFTLKEDAILFDAMEQFGDIINVQQISKDLQRDPKSIRNRVCKLKRTGISSKVKYHCFTLTEDLAVLDNALKYLDKKALKDLNLTNKDWIEVGEQLGRDRGSPRRRWEYKLKPWILQHYSGTLNLDIKRPLANYLAEHFEGINSIDWPSVISNTEFAGHTIPSLRKKFTTLIMSTKQIQSEHSEEMTLEMIAAFANTKYVLGEREVLGTELKRQKEIIDYFKCYVKTNCITDFLR